MATELPHTACTVGAPRLRGRGVHHVVVVQRREVRQLDDHRGVEHLGTVRVTQVGGQQREQWSYPLATRLDQVARHRVGQLVGVRDRLREA